MFSQHLNTRLEENSFMAEKRGEEGVSEKLLLKKAVKKRVEYLLKKPSVRVEEAYNLVKSFFKAYTGRDYEFTREELLKELDKVYLEPGLKKSLSEVIEKLGVVEFAPVSYSTEEVKTLLSSFARDVELLIHANTLKKSFWDKVFEYFKEKLEREKKSGKKAAQKPKAEEEKTPLELFLEEAEQEVESGSVKLELEAPSFEKEVEENRKGGLGVEREGLSVPVREAVEESEEKVSRQESGEEGVASKEALVAEEGVEPGEAAVEEEPPLSPVGSGSNEEGVGEKELSEEELKEFDSSLQEFYEELGAGKLDLAKLTYEELRNAYNWMGEAEQEACYDKLMGAYKNLVEALRNAGEGGAEGVEEAVVEES